LGYEELIEEVSKNCKGNKKMISEMNQIITEEEQRITELVNVITKALKEFRTEMEEKIKKEEDGKC
jgi:prefoldin subunit 5